MKKLLPTVALTAALFGTATAQIATPAASPAATVAQTVGLTNVSIDYARPALKGRRMFGDQVPYGKVWRTGANRTTKLTLSGDIMMGGKLVPAGSYGLFTIPDKGEWTIVINKDAVGPGAFAYKVENDLLRFTVKPETAPATEFFTIEFSDFTPTTANLVLRWETTQVKIALMNDPDARIMAQIREQTAVADVKPGVYFAAADYYYQTNRDLKQALEWANKVVAGDQKYWTYYLRAKIEQKLGTCPTAKADALLSLDMAKKAGDDAYVKNNERLLTECK